MPAGDQGAERSNRYVVVPRTAIFLRHGNEYLLIKGAPHKRLWPGLYNGIGGHIDRGEDALTCAKRELREETGLEADLWLCGTVIVDAGDTGVGLFVFTGEAVGGELRASTEGQPEWIRYEQLPNLPLVEDLPELLTRIHRMKRGDTAFAARSHYDSSGRLKITFSA